MRPSASEILMSHTRHHGQRSYVHDKRKAWRAAKHERLVQILIVALRRARELR